MTRTVQEKKQAELYPVAGVETSTILENLACGLILLDSQQTILSLNHWMKSHSTLDATSYEGQNFFDIFPDMKNTQLDKSIEAAIRYGIKSFLTPDINLNPLPLYTSEIVGQTIGQNNPPLSHAITIIPMQQSSGKSLCLLQIEKLNNTVKNGLFYEQSLRLHTEAETIKQSTQSIEKANQAKSEFLALMSHELRTPLNAIIGFADILKDEILGPHSISQYQDYSKDISEAGNHLLKLINDILDISKIDSEKYSLHEEVVDVSEVVRSAGHVLQMQITQNNQNFSIAFPDDLPDLKVDSRSLKQMVINLLSNAVKFTPDGGSIKVDISHTTQDGMVIAIIDNGVGVAPHEISHIMQPFTQSETNTIHQQQGTGLGLTLVKKMVELHGGAIEMTSQIGLGTTVSLTFPNERVIPI